MKEKHKLVTSKHMEREIGNVPKNIQVVSQEEAEKADVVICMRVDQTTKHRFDDNVFTKCAQCKADIYHRPHAPVAPMKVCVRCARDMMLRMQEGSDGKPN
jgi:acetyl-CoA carboxylase beta subunit